MGRHVKAMASCLLLSFLLGGCAKSPSSPGSAPPASSAASSSPGMLPPTGTTPHLRPPQTGAALHTWQLPKKEHIFALMFLPDGRHALIGNGAMVSLDANDIERRLDLKIRQPLSQMALLPDKRRFVASCWDHNSYLFDLDTGRQLKLYKQHSGNVNCLALSSDGRRMLTGGQSDKSLVLWNVEAGSCEAVVARLPHSLQSVAFLPGDREALVGSGTVQVVNIEGRKTVRSFEGKWNGLRGGLCLAPDGRHVLSAGQVPNASLVYWDSTTGQEVRRFGASNETIWNVALSSNGQRALSADNKHILHLWDVATGKELQTFSGHTGIVTALALSADGRHALSASQDDSVRCWELPE